MCMAELSPVHSISAYFYGFEVAQYTYCSKKRKLYISFLFNAGIWFNFRNNCKTSQIIVTIKIYLICLITESTCMLLIKKGKYIYKF